jgi:glycerophosphoryl diester phosphodiesterase
MQMRPRLKWHKLRRRRSDAPFLRANLVAGLIAGAALEVDLVVTADSRFLCLHDPTLDAETTGTGLVAAATRAEVEGLRQRGSNGEILDAPPLFLDEVAAAVGRFGRASGGLVQLDIKEPSIRFDDATVAQFVGTIGMLRHRFIASGCDARLIACLCRVAPGLAGGFDPLNLYDLGALQSAADFETLADETLHLAPHAAIYYLEADLVLKSLSLGVNLVDRVTCDGAKVDAWTVDADRPQLRDVLQRLVGAGVHQITTNDPDELEIVLREIA